LTDKHITDMGVATKSLTQDKLIETLSVFDTFKPKEFSMESLSATFESFWLELVKDGRFVNDFKIVKKNIGKKV